MQPVLVVEHEAQCPPALFGRWLTEAGCELDVRRPYRGDTLPTNLTGHQSMVVLGGSMDAYSDAQQPWLSEVKALVRSAVADSTPTLGICLGLQLITVALGGEVHRNPDGQQIGVLPVGWLDNAEDDALFSSLTWLRVAVQWNDDVVRDLPETAVLLAETPRGEVQAAAFAPQMWGVQWHPEVGAEIVAEWADSDRDAVLERGVDIDEHIASVAAAHEELQEWRGLAAGFATLSREMAGSTWHG
jgi:GMP synthase (glutamine-hydrolysing)